MDYKDEAKKKEDHWFRERDRELITKHRKDREERMKAESEKAQAAELEALKKQHWMCCPKDGHPMEEVDLDGILIDRCTFCDGIYFDAGELEELLLKKEESRKSIFRGIVGIFGD